MRARLPILLPLLAVIGLALLSDARAEEPLDGPKRIFRDDLLDRLVGKWLVHRKIRGKEVRDTLEADWVLNHQFLRLHMKDVQTPPEYEALVFLGYDNASERYVAHWIDVFGGRFSETLGYGRRENDSVRFVFEYPDGPFHNTFRWDPKASSWTFLLESKNPSGQWVPFAEDRLQRAE